VIAGGDTFDNVWKHRPGFVKLPSRCVQGTREQLFRARNLIAEHAGGRLASVESAVALHNGTHEPRRSASSPLFCIAGVRTERISDVAE